MYQISRHCNIFRINPDTFLCSYSLIIKAFQPERYGEEKRETYMRAPQLIQTILKLHSPNWNNFYTCNPKQEPSRASALAKSAQHERSEHSRMFTSTEPMNSNVEVPNAGNLRLVSPTMVPTLAQSVHSYSGGQHPAQLRPQPSDLVEPSRATASNTWGRQLQIIPLMHPITATD